MDQLLRKIVSRIPSNTLDPDKFRSWPDLSLFCLQMLSTDEVNPCKPSVRFVRHRQNSAKPDQMPQHAASDQVLHCLLTEFLLKLE